MRDAASLSRRAALGEERAAAKRGTRRLSPPGLGARLAAIAAASNRAAELSVRTTAPIMRRAGVRSVASVSVVAGLVATVALPAYSLASDGQIFAASSAFTSAQLDAQGVVVSSAAGAQAATVETYQAESRVQAEQTARIANWARYVAPVAQAAGDDYPYWNQTPNDFGGGLSPLGYYYRECVDFVAWRLNRDVGSTGEPYAYTWHNLAPGSAWSWLGTWQRKGWFVSTAPAAGTVAWFPYNHVAYVRSVNADGTVTIEEYNQRSDHSYHVRTIPASDATYLYPPG